MKKQFRFVVKSIGTTAISIVLVVLVSGCMSAKKMRTPDMTSHGSGIVWMRHDHFSPATLTVAVNTTVTWTNKDWWPHTVTSDTGLFDSKKMKSGKSFSYKFTTPGTYNYHCEIHDMMVAKIIVQ